MRINGGLGAETEASEGEQATEEAQLALKVPTQKNANESAREIRIWCFSLAGVALFPQDGLDYSFCSYNWSAPNEEMIFNNNQTFAAIAKKTFVFSPCRRRRVG